MIWFNLKELERRIINDEFSDQQGFSYFLAFSIVSVLTSYLTTSYEGLITLAEAVIAVGITIWGSIQVFKTNSAGDGKDFFKRYFALSWVVGIRLLVFALITLIPLSILYVLIVSPDESYTTMEDIMKVVLLAFVTFIYYYLLINSFGRVSSKTSG